ncbi:hypothetical protein LT493_11305 [Streptomyces tricolor]|nr:hypothetical protein [Streptomyces tricolor]
MKSLHRLPVPLVVLTPRVSRLSNTINSARTAWVGPPAPPTAPCFACNWAARASSTHLEHTSRLALDVWVRLMDDPVFPRDPGTKEFLPITALDLSDEPGNLRALVPFSKSFPIGKGVGVTTVADLAAHLAAVTDQELLRGTQVAKVLSVAAARPNTGATTPSSTTVTCRASCAPPAAKGCASWLCTSTRRCARACSDCSPTTSTDPT